MIRAVVFDLDNTLILEDAATFAAVRAACDRAGSAVDPVALSAAAVEAAEAVWASSPAFAYGERMGIWWGEALWGEFAGDDPALASLRAYVPAFRRAVWREALVTVGVSDDPLVDELAQAYRRARRAAEVIDPDAERVLAELARGHRMALLTNGAPDVQREKLSRTPFAPYFSAVVISAEVGFGKPDPRLFQVALQRLDVSPREAVMVGDSLARDVAGAKAAGMCAVHLDRGLWANEAGPRPDARISALRDLPAALAALAPARASPPATP